MSCHLFYGIALPHLHCRCCATWDSSNRLTDIVLHKHYFATVYLCRAAVGLRGASVFEELVLLLPTSEVE